MPAWVAAALAVAACGEGTGPTPLPAHYELVRVDGQPLPFMLYWTTMPSTTPGGPEATCDYMVVSRRLELGRRGRFTVTSSALLVCDDGRPDVASRTTSGGTYTLSGDDVTLTGDSVPPYGGTSLWLGTRSGMELRMQEQPTWGSGYGDFIMDGRTYLFHAVP